METRTRPHKKTRSPIALWWAKTRWMKRKASRLLTPKQLYELFGSHNIFFLANETLTVVGEATHDKPPRFIKGWRRDFKPCFVVFVGLQQSHWSGWPAALTIAKIAGIDTILVETPRSGNTIAVDEMVAHTSWLPDALGDRPFYVYAFSKGGFDALWLIAQKNLLPQCRHIFFMSVPFKGTKMAKVLGGKAAEELLPGSDRVIATQALLHELHDQGLDSTFYGGMIDIICPRSNCRPDNKNGYRAPSWWKLIWPRFVYALRGKWYSPPGEPWYWVKTVPQVGHTALFNFINALFFAFCAHRQERRHS